ncbi:hypothetical protein K2X05_08940, partial [bacterium]|nr:hypothetical protein [bacterium]
MTKIIFILVAFLNSMARADDKFVNEFKCLKSLSLYLSEAKFIDLTPRNTMLFFLKETNEFGMYSNEMNPAVFQIEGGRIVACALQLDHKGTAKFMVNDKSGPGQAMMYTDKEKPYFRPLGVWGSTMPTIVGGAPDRNCKDVSGDTKASEMLKKIILST